jgi:hypothetical protein
MAERQIPYLAGVASVRQGRANGRGPHLATSAPESGTALRVSLPIAKRNLLQRGFCGKRTFEIFLMNTMQRRRFSEVVEIDRCENDVVKVHVRFFEIVEKVAHRRSYSVAARRSLSFDSICAGNRANHRDIAQPSSS